MELVVHISLENLFSPAGCRHVLGICEVVVSTINYYTRLVKGPCVARFYHKLIEYTFYLINNNLSNNYYNKKRKKNWYNNYQI